MRVALSGRGRSFLSCASVEGESVRRAPREGMVRATASALGLAPSPSPASRWSDTRRWRAMRGGGGRARCTPSQRLWTASWTSRRSARWSPRSTTLSSTGPLVQPVGAPRPSAGRGHLRLRCLDLGRRDDGLFGEAQRFAAAVYGADRAMLSVHGSTGGNWVVLRMLALRHPDALMLLLQRAPLGDQRRQRLRHRLPLPAHQL